MDGGESEKRAARDWRRWILPGVVLLVVGLVCLLFAWSQREWLIVQAESLRQASVQWLRQVPLPVYILAFIILPAVGMPITIFYLTVGAMVEGVLPSLALAWLCVLANMTLCYLLTRGVLQPLVAGLVRKRGMIIPTVPRTAEWKLIVMARASPVPWVFQNYLLALGGVRFVPYVILSILVQGLVGAGVIIVGESIFAGEAKFALLGFFVLFAASFALSIVRRRADNAKRDGAALT